jgi:ADP-heptose:LPS heptosyltransferase/lauroyl/myristoyl acyltransferase
VILLLLKGLGFITSRLPNSVIRRICIAIGTLAFWTMADRRRITMSNLHHAFPEKPHKWHLKIAKKSFIRMIELGALAIARGYLTKGRIAQNFKASGTLIRVINAIRSSGRGALILIPHASLMEATTLIPEIVDVECPPIGVVYRPFNNGHLENFIKASRERSGIKLLSRKSGLIQAIKILRNNGIVAILFDQNAGSSGYTTTFFDRCAQATGLPGILATKYNVPVYCLYPRRIDTWTGEIEIEKLCQSCQSPVELAIAANSWLENKLRKKDDACADWLWAHDRWKITFNKRRLLSIDGTRSWLPETKQSLRYKTFKKNLRIFVRMPNWLGDVVMAIPVLRALKTSRPDIELTLLCQKQFIEFLENLGIADHIIALPEKGFEYFFKFFKYRKLYPDIHIVLTNSLRGDIEAYIIGATVRLGIYRRHPRPLLSDVFKFGPNFDFSNMHQTKVFGAFLQAYGLKKSISYTPYRVCLEMNDGNIARHSIGIICGSSNNPSKRWPLNYWRILIERLSYRYPTLQIKLYGTEMDAPIVDKIALGLGKYNIWQMCGKTTLGELSASMQADDLVVSCDTGGMHIANMFGRPVIGIYGPTNAIQTGPIFNAKKVIIYPDGCSSKGGFQADRVTIDRVFDTITAIMDDIVPPVDE